MRQVKAKPLTVEDFCKFGRYASTLSPQGPCIGEAPVVFYRDLVPFGGMRRPSVSVTEVQPMPLVVEVLEYHSHTPEGFLCLDEDAVICVGAATAEARPDLDNLEAFYLPRGVMVYLHPGVWHYAPYPVHDRPLHSLVLLSERTYANDCVKVSLPQEERLEIVL